MLFAVYAEVHDWVGRVHSVPWGGRQGFRSAIMSVLFMFRFLIKDMRAHAGVLTTAVTAVKRF